MCNLLVSKGGGGTRCGRVRATVRSAFLHLHLFQVVSKFLQVALDVLCCESLNVHHLKNSLRYCILDSNQSSRLDEPLVEALTPYQSLLDLDRVP